MLERKENFPQCCFFTQEKDECPKYKILVVDDNKFINFSVKKVVEKVLKNLNYEVISACDGIEMLNIVRLDQSEGNLIKCIITDENMEYLNGSQSVKIIRELEKERKIKPIIIISSTCHEDVDTKNIIYEAGSQLILSKPLNEIDLAKAFEEIELI